MAEGNEVIVAKNRQEAGRFIPETKTVSYLTDSLTGLLKGNYDYKDTKAEALKEKCEITD